MESNLLACRGLFWFPLDPARIVAHGLEVFPDRFFGGSIQSDRTLFEQDRARADIGDGREVMGDHQNCAALVAQLGGFSHATVLKSLVADAQDLVDDQNIGFHVGSDGETQADGHAARVAFDWGIEERADLGKLDDLIEAIANFGPFHP